MAWRISWTAATGVLLGSCGHAPASQAQYIAFFAAADQCREAGGSLAEEPAAHGRLICVKPAEAQQPRCKRSVTREIELDSGVGGILVECADPPRED